MISKRHEHKKMKNKTKKTFPLYNFQPLGMNYTAYVLYLSRSHSILTL